MLAGAFVAQGQSSNGTLLSTASAAPKFVPRVAEGYLFAFLAALAYGTAPVMTRNALQSADLSSAIFGGLIAYGSTAAVIAVMLLLSGALRGNVASVQRGKSLVVCVLGSARLGCSGVHVLGRLGSIDHGRDTSNAVHVSVPLFLCDVAEP